MKTIFRASILVLLIVSATTYSCDDSFLDQPPIGAVGPDLIKDKRGVEGLLIGAYSLLDGAGGSGGWGASGTNWVYGSICSGEAYKGTDAGDQSDINPIERYESLPNNPYFEQKWRALYDGVGRSNDVLVFLEQVEDITEADITRITAETRFLRGHYHFEAKKIWGNIPYIDEAIAKQALEQNSLDPYKVPNTSNDVWQKIEADFKYAYDNLPETMSEKGRANKWAAGAYLAKAYMFQQKYTEAKPLLEEIIMNGTTAAGVPYGLNALYHDNFRTATNNSQEGVFEIQFSVNDGGGGDNGASLDILNFPYSSAAPGGCCGFFQPTQNLVNSFKTDGDGLPLLETYNNEDVKSDQGVASDEPFEPYADNLDPRLDWTVGRRGLPYLDWGEHDGQSWIRDQAYAGPYSPKKNVYYKEEEFSLTQPGNWTKGYVANNYRLIRFADVLLWAAECEVEIGSLDKAREYVNQIRARAANPDGWVKDDAGDPAANYVINTYPGGGAYPFDNQDNARSAIYFERKLEFAMEGHRFFDLVRWGIAEQEINSYLTAEQNKRQYLNGASFDATDVYFPIPEKAIVNSQVNGEPTLQQNDGY
ncbi:RagB/SusD family nutrient uptake outer membrane protein [Rapidithrix thailandica]|uniref:RagB/SusD family nutrient uptake outer membrane protein n=1 Tax=Rapidithrix thailandica TaxID=413964 RepID=A0AAW9S508_9BACT